jgi:hypothetical protein
VEEVHYSLNFRNLGVAFFCGKLWTLRRIPVDVSGLAGLSTGSSTGDLRIAVENCNR